MPHPAGRTAGATAGAQPGAARRPQVLRTTGAVVAVALGAVAVWLIVTGASSPRRVELGVLAGLWGLLLAAFSAFGTRRPPRYPPAPPPAGAGQELLLRPQGHLEQADEADARRHFELRIEQMLRQEIQTTLGREIASLRDEVASLRNDLLEKVGGQLRLERIETTRVIGSDIEALQREIDQLKHGRPVLDAVTVAPEPTPEPAPEPVPAREPADTTGAAAGVDGDIFAELPRLRPFTDFELDPPLPPPVADPAGPEAVDEPPLLTPRRPDGSKAAGARHSRGEDGARGQAGGGRRRRAADDDEDSVLARILARETTR